MKKSNFLREIIVSKKREVTKLLDEIKANKNHPINRVSKRTALHFERKFENALKKPSFLSVIGEIKKRSPSKGLINGLIDPVDQALRYCKANVSAISVLTESKYFGGSLNDLGEVASEMQKDYPHIPLLRKDFIIHKVQLAESLLYGASAVLLIVAVVGDNLKELLDEAERLGLEALVEIHNARELEIALNANANIIGINHRNLNTFDVDLSISEQLIPSIPPYITTVVESGIYKKEQTHAMFELGFDGVLVGEALMKSEDPQSFIEYVQEAVL